MSEYSDWLERWATTEGMGLASNDPICTGCGHPRSSHSEEMPYDCNDDCPCKGFSYVSADEQEWSEDDWQYWCRSEKRTAVDWLRDQDVLP